jgi:L-fuconolactonase
MGANDEPRRRPTNTGEISMKDAPLRFTLLAGVAALLASGANPSVAQAKGHPIMDTHIHLYQVTRPGGVPWPEAKNKVLYKDMTPAEYKAVAKKNGIVGTGIMEASPIHEDNLKLLAATKKDKFFKFLVAQVEIGSADFAKHLDELAKDPRVVGIRGFLWSPKMTLDDKQVKDLQDLAKRGMTLDLISRGDLNPKAKVIELATKVPDLRIIIDHLGGAKGEKPDPKWAEDMKKLSEHKNIYMKFSSFFDMFNPKATEDEPWQAPQDVSAYKPHFDVLVSTFGEDRLIWGSNWPVVRLGAGGEDTALANEIKIAEEYLKPLGQKVRDKIMFQNAQKFYKRVPIKS